MNLLLPEILAGTRDGTSAKFQLRVPADLAHFEGHFPGLPILPGVVQIDWAIRLARRYFVWDAPFAALENVKFQSVVAPEARLVLTLLFDPRQGRLGFSYTSAGRKFSSGQIVFREPA